jgi:hypothetical protein
MRTTHPVPKAWFGALSFRDAHQGRPGTYENGVGRIFIGSGFAEVPAPWNDGFLGSPKLAKGNPAHDQRLPVLSPRSGQPWGRSQLTIHGMPNRSTSMPKRCAQKVSAIGMVTVPPSANALKTCSASVGWSMLRVTVMPLAGS